jgi:hypothetical protein
MHKLAMLSLIAASAAVMHAQSPCTPPSPGSPATLSNPPVGTNWYTAFGQSLLQAPAFLGSDGYTIDLTLTGSVTLNGFSCQLFNDGDNTPTGVPGLNLGTQPSATNPPIGPTQVNAVVWECPGSWVGNAQTFPGVWTQIGTATAMYTGPWSSQTQFTMTAPTFLTAGAHGILLEFRAIPNLACTQYNNVTTAYAPWGPMVNNPAAPPTHADTFVSMTNFGWQRNTFLDVPQTTISPGFTDIPMSITYTPAAGAAYYNSFGNGCIDFPKSFRDHFTMAAPAVPFDLSNCTVSLIPNGPSSYTVFVTHAAPSWFNHTSPNIGSVAGPFAGGNSDDGLLPLITLPFTFPHPTGTATQIEINTNGDVHLAHDPSTAWIGGGYYDDHPRWLAKPPNFAICFGDLDTTTIAPVGSPGTPYGIWYDVDPSGNQVYVTWYTQEWDTGPHAPAGTMEFQLMLDSSGFVEYRYRSVAMSPTGNPGGNAPILVGYTPGLGVRVPNVTDLSTTGPFNTGDDTRPTTMTLSARPVINTTTNCVTTNVHPTTIAGATYLGFGPINPGIPLPGAPTCNVYGTSLLTPAHAVIGLSIAPVSSMTHALFIPNMPSLAGLTLVGQSALLVGATANPFGGTLPVLTSNGVCIGIGN